MRWKTHRIKEYIWFAWYPVYSRDASTWLWLEKIQVVENLYYPGQVLYYPIEGC